MVFSNVFVDVIIPRRSFMFGQLHANNIIIYRKIPKISPGAYIFQRPFLRGLFLESLYSEGLIYGGKFAFQN